MVIYAPHHGEVWMTVWEIAELLNVTGTAVKNTIKALDYTMTSSVVYIPKGEKAPVASP